MGLAALCTSIHKADVIVFCDNEAVVGALVSGRSDIPIAAKWLENIFSIEEKQDLCLWFERVPSESNPADEPSRGITKDLPESIKVSANLGHGALTEKLMWRKDCGGLAVRLPCDPCNRMLLTNAGDPLRFCPLWKKE